jgi:hypothetical protein
MIQYDTDVAERICVEEVQNRIEFRTSAVHFGASYGAYVRYCLF